MRRGRPAGAKDQHCTLRLPPGRETTSGVSLGLPGGSASHTWADRPSPCAADGRGYQLGQEGAPPAVQAECTWPWEPGPTTRWPLCDLGHRRWGEMPSGVDGKPASASPRRSLASWNGATPAAGENSGPFEKTAADVPLGPDGDGRSHQASGPAPGEPGSVTSSSRQGPIVTGGRAHLQQARGAWPHPRRARRHPMAEASSEAEEERPHFSGWWPLRSAGPAHAAWLLPYGLTHAVL